MKRQWHALRYRNACIRKVKNSGKYLFYKEMGCIAKSQCIAEPKEIIDRVFFLALNHNAVAEELFGIAH